MKINKGDEYPNHKMFEKILDPPPLPSHVDPYLFHFLFVLSDLKSYGCIKYSSTKPFGTLNSMEQCPRKVEAYHAKESNNSKFVPHIHTQITPTLLLT
jgi:hypothetical protein